MNLFLFREEQQTGPYTEVEARRLVFAGEITRDCPAWYEGMPEWLPLDEIVALPPLPPTADGTKPTIPVGLPPVPPRAAWIPPVSPGKTTTEGGPDRVDRWAVLRLPGVKYGFRIGALLAVVIIRSQCQHH